MVDFKKVTMAPGTDLVFKLEISLANCKKNSDEAAERLSYLFNSSSSRVFSEFIVALLRETSASTWELKNLEITE